MLTEEIKKLAHTEVHFPWKYSLPIGLMIVVFLGIIIGSLTFAFPDFVEAKQESFLFFTGTMGVLIPTFVGVSAAFLNKEKTSKKLAQAITKDFIFAIVFVSIGLLVEAIVFSGLCGNTCNEFSAFSLLLVLFWIPIMTVISLLLTIVITKILNKK